LHAQLEAVKEWSDSSAMDATFTSTAVVLLPTGEQSLAGDHSLAANIASLNPHSTATFDHFTSGGNASVSWFTAELHFTVVNAEPGYGLSTDKSTIRAVELLDGSAGWKIAVAAFTSVATLQRTGSCKIEHATPPGPLVSLLASPDELARTLAPDAVVLGTDPGERGVGPRAKALVGMWHKLKLSLDTKQHAREVHTATYGYGMTNVTIEPARQGGTPRAMSGFVLALPGPKDTWSVVAASYGATY
jgi:hypothetical protein